MAPKPSTAARKALFLDRDGVINLDHGYVFEPERFEFVPGIFELVRHANDVGWPVVVVTNQSGIARGLYSEAAFSDLMAWVQECFAEYGAQIDDLRYCPHHPDAVVGRYRKRCDCRKPAPGMLLAAAAQLGLDLPGSLMVGDGARDMQAALAAGVGHRCWLGATPAQAGREQARAVSSLVEAQALLLKLHADIPL